MVFIESTSEHEEEFIENDYRDINWCSGLKDFFEVIRDDGRNVKVSCKKCLPVNTSLSTLKSSVADLLKHVQVCISLLIYIE